jgi:hypothetical protein
MHVLWATVNPPHANAGRKNVLTPRRWGVEMVIGLADALRNRTDPPPREVKRP